LNIRRNFSIIGNTLTQGEFFQGDIRLVPGQLEKNGVLLDSLKWPNATVHYKLEGLYGEFLIFLLQKMIKYFFNKIITESDLNLTDLVMDAIADYHSKTCIKFEPYDGSQTAYIVLTDVDAAGCSSFFGRLGTRQIVDLKFPGCAHASY
jgi:Astacin (Peptidase family M12A)